MFAAHQQERRFSIRRGSALGLVLAGAILLAAALAGHSGLYTGLDRLANGAPRSVESLFAQAAGQDFKTLSPEDQMQRLYSAVTDRIPHSGLSSHTVFTNWIMWALGTVDSDLGTIRMPNNLLRYTDSAICSQQSYLLLTLAEKAGIPSRHVGLIGHVVMESWYDGAWHMYDPTFGIVPTFNGTVASVAGLRENGSLLAQYDEWPDIKTAFQQPQRHNYIAYPAGGYFVWKAQVLYHAEQAADWLKFALPAAFIAFGGLLLARPSGRMS